MGLVGIALIFAGGWLLLLVYGLASLVPLDSNDPGYWPLVWSRMVEYGMSELIVASLGLLLGIVFVTLAIRGKRPVGPAKPAGTGSS
jgi:hypothetical protein